MSAVYRAHAHLGWQDAGRAGRGWRAGTQQMAEARGRASFVRRLSRTRGRSLARVSQGAQPSPRTASQALPPKAVRPHLCVQMRFASRLQVGARTAQRPVSRAPHSAAAAPSGVASGVPVLRDRTSAALNRLRRSRKWDHLRDLDALEKHIGKTIELPDLRVRPKGLTDDSLTSYLLTEQRCFLSFLAPRSHAPQRFMLWKEISAGLQPGRPRNNNGIVLSGPHGVGKSHLIYLAAAAAFVNSHIVGYWVRRGKEVGD